MMNKLWIIIKTEYATDIKSVSFWVSTILFPILMFGFGIFVGFLSTESSVLASFSSGGNDMDDSITGWEVLGLITGMLLTLCIMINGAQIFNKVKVEKCNRIVEILSTCVEGRTMMLAKVISVFLISMTQLALWGLILLIFIGVSTILAGISLPLSYLLMPRLWMAIIWSILFFTGGYVFYGSLYAACGAITDKNNENQGYMTILTFLLLAALYIGMYAVDNSGGTLSLWCSYIPFTAPTVATVRAIGGTCPIWQTLLSLGMLYLFAWLAISLAGKIYRSALLLTGKKFSLNDIIVFLKTK